MVYCDTPMESPKTCGPRFREGQMFVHLTADSEFELLAYAKRLGLKAGWLQKGGTPEFHFDVTGRNLKAVLADPEVMKLTDREFVARIQQKRRAFQCRSVER